MNEAAIVTLAVGEPYHLSWREFCEADWRAYASKHGFDVIVLTDPIDSSPRGKARSISWQKCLALSQPWAANYRQIVLLDCDILINFLDAPSIVEQVSPDLVGGVISGSQIPADLRTLLRGKTWPYERGVRQWQEDQNAIYAMHELGPRPEGIVQGGVLVASPSKHAELFRSIYESTPLTETRGYEQIPLSHALLEAGAFQQIDTRFNSVFWETVVVHYPFLAIGNFVVKDDLAMLTTRVQYGNNFFLHFANCLELMSMRAKWPPQWQPPLPDQPTTAGI